VLLSAQSQATAGRAAREELCRLYWYPLYAYIRKRGHNPDDARDLTQGFFLTLFHRKTLRSATPLKGKFRSYLLACLKNYLSVEFHRENAIKRGRGIEFVPLDLEGAEDRYRKEPADSLTPDKVFDARWATTLLNRAMDSFKEEYEAQGKSAVFDSLKPFLDVGGNQESPAYEVVAEKLKVSLSSAKTLIHRFRKRYAEIVRKTVAETVADPAEVDNEIRALCDALVAAEGRLGP
jgi:DNA-directed RNA polymerase specialized sigma24 family protein